jgi:hypothetical protein
VAGHRNCDPVVAEQITLAPMASISLEGPILGQDNGHLGLGARAAASLFVDDESRAREEALQPWSGCR